MINIVLNVFKILTWSIRQIRFENFRNYIKKEYRDNPAVVLANGPSLNEEISSLLSLNIDCDYCVVNDFCQSDYFAIIKPAYYVLADPMYFNESWQRNVEKKTINILKKVTWKIKLYIPFDVYTTNIASILKVNRNIHLVPFHTNEYNGFNFFRFFLYAKGWSMPRAQNVIIPCIFNLINMGYKQIYLYGVDHSWTKDIIVNKSNEVCLINKHFYHENAIATRWLKFDGTPYKLHEVLQDISYMFAGYHLLKKYADENNCTIYNMTCNSFIDAFERL